MRIMEYLIRKKTITSSHLHVQERSDLIMCQKHKIMKYKNIVMLEMSFILRSFKKFISLFLLSREITKIN